MAFADNTLKAYADNSKAMFDYWISFFPTAPAFGVEWRFGAALNPGTEYVAPEKPEVAVETPVHQEAAVGGFAATDVTVASETDVVAEADAVVEVDEPETVTEEAGTEADISALLYSEPPAEIDDLKILKGVGPNLEAQLNDLGVYTFEQLASFDEAQLEWLDGNLSTVKGRCIRDDWSGQAKALLA